MKRREKWPLAEEDDILIQRSGGKVKNDDLVIENEQKNGGSLGITTRAANMVCYAATQVCDRVSAKKPGQEDGERVELAVKNGRKKRQREEEADEGDILIQGNSSKVKKDDLVMENGQENGGSLGMRNKNVNNEVDERLYKQKYRRKGRKSVVLEDGESGREGTEVVAEKQLAGNGTMKGESNYSLRNPNGNVLVEKEGECDKRECIANVSLMCHQCQRNDKGRVVRCQRCLRKRYCIPCLKTWYPNLKEDEIAESCPFCRNNCNCKACLRLGSRLDVPINDLKNYYPVVSDGEKVYYSKYVVETLLPYLKQIDEEQMKEKEVEAMRLGIPLGSLYIGL